MLTLRSVLLIFFFSIPAQADPVSLEQDVFNLSVEVKSLLLKYYHFQADEGNGELIMELNQRVKNTDQLQNQILSSLGGRYLQQSQNIKQHWRSFNQYLSVNLAEIQESAYPELQVVTLMRTSVNSLITELDILTQLLQQHEAVTISAAENWSRHQKRLLLGVVELYIERAASSMGAPLTIEGASLTELSAEFKKGLSVYPLNQANSETQRALSRIRGQWLFIEKSTSNQSAQLVPYLVMRYTGSILKRLTQLAT